MTELFPEPARHDPGGKRHLALAPDVTSWARFGGPDDCYRWVLGRHWPAGAGMALFVMMNPSTADHRVDDPTVAKVSRMARAWGYSVAAVCNVFAYRCTDQRQLAEVADPIGPENDDWILSMARAAGIVVMAYGTPQRPQLRARGPAVARRLHDLSLKLHVLRLSPKGGVPMHPLYLPENLCPEPWTPPAP